MDDMTENLGRTASTGAPSRYDDDRMDDEFIGTYPHTVDAKGRVVVPAAFRDMLGDSFYIAPTHDFSAVGLYTRRSWVKTKNRLMQVCEYDSSVADLLDEFFHLSYSHQECDGQGRVLLPPLIREKLLGSDKDLEISGAGDHVNIMTTAMAAEKFRQVKGNMPAILKTINQLRMREINGARGVLSDRREE